MENILLCHTTNTAITKSILEQIMLKTNRLYLLLAIIIMSLIFGGWAVQAKTNRIETEEEQIKEIIEIYFDMRYLSHHTLSLEDFGSLTDPSSQGNDFSNSEMEKLEIELYHAKVNHLRYLEYDFFLEFTDISINMQTRTAAISVIEGHDVVFESSKGIYDDEPIVSSMRNLEHVIVLRKENDTWMIVDDDYEDYLWHLLNSTKQTKEEMLDSMDYSSQLSSATTDELQTVSEPLNIQQANFVYPYDRDGAIAYAHYWALKPQPYNYPPPYDDFTDMGGDCTNFTSQAIREGGGAFMYVSDEPPGVGNKGWYYHSMHDRGKAWPYVDEFYKFTVTERNSYDAGPEGSLVSLSYLDYGDIIQYNWENDAVWDHGVIVVGYTVDHSGNMIPLVDGHTPDVKRYDYRSFDYHDVRFIHIERLKAPHGTYLPLILNNEAPTGDPLYSDPYPAPLEYRNTQPLEPYPAP
ncbi:MAG: amidase domain-containing protein [Chloroflexi bacterium]|nr:amidase domain-containing protein [Chloroflexota bacterium]